MTIRMHSMNKLPAPTCSPTNHQLQSERHVKPSKFRQRSRSRCSSGTLRRLVHSLGPSVSEDRIDGRQAGGDKRALAHPVVVHVAVDGSEVVGEVDVDSGRDHGEEGEEERVCDISIALSVIVTTTY